MDRVSSRSGSRSQPLADLGAKWRRPLAGGVGKGVRSWKRIVCYYALSAFTSQAHRDDIEKNWALLPAACAALKKKYAFFRNCYAHMTASAFSVPSIMKLEMPHSNAYRYKSSRQKPPP